MSHDEPAPYHGAGRQLRGVPADHAGWAIRCGVRCRPGQQLAGDLARSVLGDAEQHAVIVLPRGSRHREHREVAIRHQRRIRGQTLHKLFG